MVPASTDPARGWHLGVVAGAGDRSGALAVHLWADAADASNARSVVGDVVADRAVRSGAAPIGVGQRGRDRPAWPAGGWGRRVLRTLATRVHQLRPRDPESKGVVERRNGFFETSFMPGRDFASPADFNDQFGSWLERANRREVRTLKARPIDLVDADRAAMLALPPIPPSLGWSNQIRLGRDYYVRVDSNDYSADPAAIGRQVTITADLERVRVRLDGRLVADHARIWARHMTVADPVHVAAAQELREQVGRPSTRDDELVRDLADYDRAFGVDGMEVA